MSEAESRMPDRASPQGIGASELRIAFIGSAGVPNRYGGFEAFLEHSGPAIAQAARSVVVTCDGRLYPDLEPSFRGMRREFLTIPANGASSIVHDLVAFFRVYRDVDCIVVLGVSGGAWFPLFRVLCDVGGRRLLVNVDGIEWKRAKFSAFRRAMLWCFDRSAQLFAHRVIVDNGALRPFLARSAARKSLIIGYSGDHVIRLPEVANRPSTALTICRIEPENNVDMLIEGFLVSPLSEYTIVGNWANSEYGKALRARHAGEKRLRLLDPIYDAMRLAELREACGVYLHGHSVGGTNPSLVEMLFYDSRILCFDVPYHRETAAETAEYFSTVSELSERLARSADAHVDRASVRDRFTARGIAEQYLSACSA